MSFYGFESIARLSQAESRSISAENFKGEKGRGGMATEGSGKYFARFLGQGWKISPSITIPKDDGFTLTEIEGPGTITHIWFTCFPKTWRDLIFKIYWDEEAEPSVEVPIGDFFCNGWCEQSTLYSIPVTVAPSGGFNSYWPMPFRKKAKIIMENRFFEDTLLYYQIDYYLDDVPEDVAYFHAQFRLSNPVKYKEVHTILDNVSGRGHYVGTYLAWQSNSCDWWGEGQVKFYLDGDDKFPTICGTGTEDYVGGAFNFEMPAGSYHSYSAPFVGMHQIITPDGLYRSQQRFGMYRWHIPDPIRFQSDLRVTIQALGVRDNNRFLPLRDNVASTAFWYQTEPHNKFQELPDDDARYVSHKIDR
jgi:hypothetical protein